MQITANEAKKIYGKRRRVELTEDMDACGAVYLDRLREMLA